MLILSHTDGLGIDFHQLCQRVLKPSGDGHRGAQVYIILREFLGGQGRGRVDGGAGFVDDHIAGLGEGTQHLHGHGLDLPGGSAVADGNVADVVSAHHAGKNGDGLLFFAFAEGGIHHTGVQHLSGGIHHGHLAAVAVARVQAHGDKALHGRLHQQRLQIQGEVADGSLTGAVGEFAPNFPLDGGEDQPFIGILGGGAHKAGDLQAGLQRGAADQGSTLIPGQGDGGLQNALLFAPVDGENLVIQQPGNGLGEIIVQGVDAFGFGVVGLAVQTAPAHHQLPQSLADVGVVGKVFRNDVIGSGEGLFDGVDALFRVHKVLSQLLGVLSVLGKNHLRQGSQPLFPGHGAPGAALLLVGTVEILHLGHGCGGVDGVGQLPGELSLVFDGLFDLVPALLQIAQVGEPGFQSAQGGVVHGAVHFLAVAGDEGDGVAFVDEGNDVLNIFQLLIQLRGENFSNCLHTDDFLPCFFRGEYTTFPAKMEVEEKRNIRLQNG